jgi:hypothetical protein
MSFVKNSLNIFLKSFFLFFGTPYVNGLNLLIWKMHMSPKANGVDNIHDNNLKEFLNKEVKAKKEAQKEQKKAKVTMKQIKDWVFKYATKGKFVNCFLNTFFFSHMVVLVLFHLTSCLHTLVLKLVFIIRCRDDKQKVLEMHNLYLQWHVRGDGYY